MKSKHLFLIGAALVVAIGLWFWRAPAPQESGLDGNGKSPGDRDPVQILSTPARHAPPDPNRKFQKLTPEERVKLARRGPIGG